MNSPSTIYINNDQIIRLEGLEDSDGSSIDNAVVTASILDYRTDAVISQVTLSPVSGEAGNYEGLFEDNIDIKFNVTYRIKVDASDNNLKGSWSKPIKAIYRDF